MKKLFYVLSMAVAAMSISACNNLIEEESPAFGAGSDNKIVFTASTEAEAEGRTALDLSDGQSVVWNGTEKFGLFYYYTPAGGSEVKFVKNYVYTANANGTESAKFTGEAAWWDGDGDVDEVIGDEDGGQQLLGLAEQLADDTVTGTVALLDLVEVRGSEREEGYLRCRHETGAEEQRARQQGGYDDTCRGGRELNGGKGINDGMP